MRTIACREMKKNCQSDCLCASLPLYQNDLCSMNKYFLNQLNSYKTEHIPLLFFDQHIQLAILWVLFTLIVVGNSIVLIAIWLVRHKKSRLNFFVTNLAVAGNYSQYQIHCLNPDSTKPCKSHWLTTNLQTCGNERIKLLSHLRSCYVLKYPCNKIVCKHYVMSWTL